LGENKSKIAGEAIIRDMDKIGMKGNTDIQHKALDILIAMKKEQFDYFKKTKDAYDTFMKGVTIFSTNVDTLYREAKSYVEVVCINRSITENNFHACFAFDVNGFTMFDSD